MKQILLKSPTLLTLPTGSVPALGWSSKF